MNKILSIPGQNRISFDGSAQAFLIMIFFGQLLFNNGIYLFAAAFFFWIIFINLQQPLKPSVFTLIFIYHYIQIAAGIWLSNYLGSPIDFRSPSAGDATIFAFIGLFVMMLPIIYYQNKIPILSMDILRKHAEQVSIKRSFYAYLISFFLANFLGGIALTLGGFAQIVISLMKIKWFFFLFFGFQVVLKKRMTWQFVAMIALEFLLGMLSYFSDFKTVIFFSGCLFIGFLVKVNLKQVVYAFLAITLMFFLAIKWTSIKGEYRQFLTQGETNQSVQVEKEEAFSKLVELSKSESDYDQAAINMLDRLQYTYHLSKTMDRVPSVIPYQDGLNWQSILEFTLTPRLLDPNKPKIDNSLKTTKYTGVSYLSSKKGVSFSLGYFADSYIDFGFYGMMIPLLILGFIYGASYYFFVRKSSPNLIFNFSVVGAMYLEFHGFEMDGTFLMGRLFATLLIFYLLKYFGFPQLYRHLKLRPNESRFQ